MQRATFGAPVVTLAVADSHALIWFALGPRRKLGRRAAEFFVRAEKGAATLYVPTFVLFEVSEALRRGRVSAPEGFSQWVSNLFARPGFVPVDLTVDVVLAAEALRAIPDRGDRVIAATAAHLGCSVITRDPAIARAAGIETIW